MPFDATTQAPTTFLCQVRDHVAEPGAWIQSRMVAGSARCLLGWIYEVSGYRSPTAVLKLNRLIEPILRAMPQDEAAKPPLRLSLEGYINSRNDPAGKSLLVLFNDRRTTTQADVVALLNRAIEIQEGIKPLKAA